MSSPAALSAPTTSSTPTAMATAPTATWDVRGASGPQSWRTANPKLRGAAQAQREGRSMSTLLDKAKPGT
eukprot:9003922-Pyramimonas_sp.AAC.1